MGKLGAKPQAKRKPGKTIVERADNSLSVLLLFQWVASPCRAAAEVSAAAEAAEAAARRVY